MAYVVNTQPLVRRYRAGLCSGAYCLCLLTVVATVLLPLFFGLAAGGFWTKELIRFEQPDVLFSNDLVVVATGQKLMASGASLPITLGYSTSPRVNSLLSTSVRAPTIESSLLSISGDARVDEASWTISLPLAASETITAVSIVLPCQLRLHDTVRLDTATAVLVSHSGGTPGRGLVVTGDARLVMRMQLPSGTRYLDPAAGAEVVSFGSATSLADVAPETVARTLAARNVTLVADAPSAMWLSDAAFSPRAEGSDAGTAAGGFEALSTRARVFTLELSLRISPQPVWLRPTLSETLKLAWMQYLALLVPVFAVFWSLSCLVFDSGIVDASADADRVVKAKLH